MPQHNDADQVGDVKITNAKPGFEYIKPSKQSDLGRPALLLFLHVCVQVAGGAKMLCQYSATLDLQIDTAAGPLHLTNISCLIMDGNEREMLLGRETMQHIGIDIYRLFEPLAGGSKVGEADDDDVTSESPRLDFNVDRAQIKDHLNRTPDEARDAGFDPKLLGKLRA
ncbi:unnamed protein product [Phytophthora fragariaefolia]|uniref:Unnamed protein product n=1 Tax=Phytophthora fragariaefolia TaxID=1490495 RepID=A0A9W7D164_9STRA|nr:unnamed protein product [Phytophthora fragariaefolia]